MNFPRFTNFINEGIVHSGASAAPGAAPGALPAGGVGRAGSALAVPWVTSCPSGETSHAFLCCDATKSFVAFGNSVEEGIALCFFYFKLRRRGGTFIELFTGSAVLEGTNTCNSRPGFGRIKHKGEANQGRWIPQIYCTQ